MFTHFAYFKSCLIIFVSCLCTNIYLFVLNIDDFSFVGAMLLSRLCPWLFTIHHISYVTGFAVTVYIANISLAEVNNYKYCEDLSDSLAQGLPKSPPLYITMEPVISSHQSLWSLTAGSKHRQGSGKFNVFWHEVLRA